MDFQGYNEPIIQALKEALKERGQLNPVTEDQVETYRNLSYIKKKLEDDIRENGVTREYDHGGGQKGYKKNDSIGELNKTITQMSKILYDLNLRSRDIKVDEEGGGDV